MVISRKHPLLLLLVLVLVTALTFAACDDDDDEEDGGDETPAATETDDGADGGEIDISGVEELDDGTLTIGSDIAYAPIEFFEEGTDNEMGLDVDIANAMAEKLGVEVEFQQVADFAGIVGDLTSGRYDIVMSAISITPEREAEIDFIPYFGPVGTGILTLKDNPEGFASVEDLCGHPVAAQDGTFQVEQMEILNDGPCAGNPIDIRAFPDNPASVQELILGRVDAQLADDPVAAYSALQNEEDLIELAVPGFEAAPYGIGVRKDSTALNEALTAAFEAIVADGTYDAILEEWGQSQFAYEG
jgi:polar amino acid transport system substrate-binding protein